MMKRLMSLLLTIILMLPYMNCMAEEFILHSGVKFGMTMEEVEESEEKAGYETIHESTYYCDVPSFVKLAVANPELFKGDTWGKVGYCFDRNNNTVNACIYYDISFGEETTPSKEEVVNAYLEKYGTPTVQNSYISFPGEACDAYTYIAEYSAKHSYVNIEDIWKLSIIDTVDKGCYQWLIPQEDGSMIDIMLLEHNGPRYSDKEYLAISYSLRTAEEVEANMENWQKKLQEKQQQQQLRQNDI